VFSGGQKYFHGRQVPAFYTEKLAGTGVVRFPGNFEMPALEAVRRTVRDVCF
jgi:hypothetical protein